MKASERAELIATLKARIAQNMHRHEGKTWAAVAARLDDMPESVKVLKAMEESGDEPDVISIAESGQVTFCDCSRESPAGRRSLCYDRPALDARKENKPRGSAVEEATQMEIELLTEQQYRELQQLEELDLKTSSWILTPPDVRSPDGALFCDRRYGRVFVYHNGAQSYYAARGFRGRILV